MIKVKLDDAGLQKMLADLAASVQPAVARQALDRAASSAKTDLARQVATDTGLGVAQVKERVQVQKTDGATRTIMADARRTPLIEFKAKGPEPSKGRGSGVTYRLPGGRGRLAHAFITTVRRGKGAGRRGVFERLGAEREPLEEKTGPSVWQSATKFVKEVGDRALEVLRERLRHEITRRGGSGE